MISVEVMDKEYREVEMPWKRLCPAGGDQPDQSNQKDTGMTCEAALRSVGDAFFILFQETETIILCVFQKR